jgi:hypothetical protein
MSATGLMTIDLLCYSLTEEGVSGCKARFVQTIPKAEASYEAVAAAGYVCPDCGGPLKRVPSSPNLMQRALPDGVKRKGWQDAKESARLEIEIADTTDENKRNAIRSEIRKMGIAPTI